MKLSYAAYVTLSSSLFLSLFPPFFTYTRLTGRYRKGLKERLGFFPAHSVGALRAGQRIWIHGASLGEIRVAAAIKEHLKELVPECGIILSATTDHGCELAREIHKEGSVVYAPLDLVFSVRKALSVAKPSVMVFLETEIWPAWLFEARRMGIRTTLVNGRISGRSVHKYKRFRFFFRNVLESVDQFSMISQDDAERIIALGADPKRVTVNGNGKYEFLGTGVDPYLQEKTREMLNLAPSQNVFVAGSTRTGEEPIILAVYEKVVQRHPDTILVIAPRHLTRIPEIKLLLRSRGFEYQLWSQLRSGSIQRSARVVIVDTYGELFNLYSVGTINFCGASLVPLGGQNPLEAAVWGKVVFYGPSMEDFHDAKTLLEKQGAGIEVSSSESFAEKALRLLENPESARARGLRAREAVVSAQGAARRHAQVIARLLPGPDHLMR